jgi:hypothetical protein
MKLVGKTLIAVLVCCLAAGSLMAQSTRGGIQGTVTDETGALLPGTSVVISSEAMQGNRTAICDADGAFRFMLLPPGVYKAVFALSGFQRVEQENIRVPIEGVVTLEVTLNSTFSEEVLVTSESPVIDVTSTTIGSNLGEQILSDVPIGRDFTSVTFLATGAVDGGGIANDALAGNASIMGASALENRYVVDQLDTTDAAEGRAGTRVSTSFIEEVQVKTAGYQAEYGGALGGVVNMITKSGGNEFHGDAFGFLSNDSLWAEADETTGREAIKTVDNEWDVGFTMGGKLIEDKLWYFAGFNPSTLDQNVYNPVYGPDDTIVQDNEWIRAYNTDFFSAKLNWQANESNSLSFTVLGDPTTIENEYYDTGLYIDSPAVPATNIFADVDEGGINYGVNWNAIVTESNFFEISVGHHQNTQEYLPQLNATNYQDQTSDGIWTNGVGGSAYFGGYGFRQPLDDRTRDQVRGSFTWFLGDDHEVKLGAGYNTVEYDMDYNVNGPSDAFCAPAVTDGNPWFDWDGPAGFDHDTGEYYEMAYNCDSNGDGALDGIMMPARVGNRFRLRNSYYYNRNYKNRSTGKTTEYNVYAQDSWALSDNFTVSIGLRAESTNSKGNLTKIMPERQLDFGLSDMIAPRVGFIWDPAKDGRSKVFAHYGKFYQSIPLTLNVRSFGNEQYDFVFYNNPEDGSLPSTDNPGEFFYYVSSRSEYTALDPDIEPQYLEEYVIGGEYEVATDLALAR